MMTLTELALALPGSCPVGDGSTPFTRVHTDTRSLASGDLFVALRGERFDANDFLAEAAARGASAALCHRGRSTQASGLPCLEVDDTGAALLALARHWRGRFALPLIAVTGSNGKTTVTQMLASILTQAAGPEQALATRGNFNNAIGVPLTLLRLREEHRLAVLELGMNHPGEIAELAAVAQPTVALVNNAQREHQEFMHTVEAVARENGAVLAALPAAGVAVVPAADAFTPLWRQLAQGRRLVCFGSAADGTQPDADTLVARSADWDGSAWRIEAQGLGCELQLQVRVPGRHNVHNALAAAACARAAGVEPAAIEAGLAVFEPVAGRSRMLSLTLSGVPCTVIDDSYNANPDSVTAAIELLATLPAGRLLVLGDMGEVGTQGEAFHREVGALLAPHQIELHALGTLARAAADAAAGHWYPDHAALATALRARLAPGHGVRSIVVKGSRFMQMERALHVLQALAAADREVSCC